MGNYAQPIPRSLEGVLILLELFKEAAVAAAKAARWNLVRSRQQRRGKALRPGANTPMWNILVGALNEECKKYGAKAKLARHIGLPRQRVHEFLRGKSAMPDAERALVLLHWLAEQRQQPAPITGKASPKTPAA